MATYAIILFLLLAVIIMPSRLESTYTRDELADMGIQLDSTSVETR